MYQHILAPVDGSAGSRHGLAEAIAVARLAGGRIRVVHVIDEPFLAMGVDGAMCAGPDVFQIVREAGEAILAEAEAQVRQAGIAVDRQLLDSLNGRMCDLVVQAARDWPADLIVIGTHGRRGIGRMLLGSGAEQILRLSPVPVLLVRDPADASAVTQAAATA